MKNQWQVEQLVEAIAGQLLNVAAVDECIFSSVTTDSRQVEAPALYVAIQGERFDGHQFIPQAIENGAVAILCQANAVETAWLEQFPKVAWVAVAETRLALGQFAAWHRQQLQRQNPNMRWIGVTGSNGKTTNKTLLNTVLQNFAPTFATQGNLNNELGVPRSILAVTLHHQLAVIEMGANHVGEIDYLANMVKPQVGLITNVSAAHIGEFGSLENILQTKGELLSHIETGGSAVLPEALIHTWQSKCEAQSLRCFSFGESSQAAVQLINFEQKPEQICFSLQVNQTGLWQGQTFHLCLPVLGKHNALNVCATFAVGLALDLDLRLFPAALQMYEGVGGRLDAETVALPSEQTEASQSITLIDDSYNANPASVKAGIETLVQLAQTSGGESMLCLGAMAELGEQSFALHQEVGQFAKAAGVNYLWVAGQEALPAALGFGEGAKGFETAQQLAEVLTTQLQQATIQAVTHILVKGSRSAGMETVVAAIQEQAKC